MEKEYLQRINRAIKNIFNAWVKESKIPNVVIVGNTIKTDKDIDLVLKICNSINFQGCKVYVEDRSFDLYDSNINMKEVYDIAKFFVVTYLAKSFE